MKPNFKQLEIIIGHSVFPIIQKMVLLVVAHVPWHLDFQSMSVPLNCTALCYVSSMTFFSPKFKKRECAELAASAGSFQQGSGESGLKF